MSSLKSEQVVIAADEAVSNPVDCGVNGLNALVMPDEWNVADLTMQWSLDGEDWYDICTPDGHELVVTVLPGGMVPVSTDYRSVPFLRLRSGTAQAPIAQIELRTFAVILDTGASGLGEPTPMVKSKRRGRPSKSKKKKR